MSKLDGRNVLSRSSRHRKKRTLGKMFMLLIMLVIIGVGAFAGVKMLLNGDSLASASSVREDFVVTEVAAMGSAAKDKAAPTLYNGMKRKVVYLTFDDGPNVHTPQLLDILKSNDIKGTFFMLGENAKENPEIVKRMYDEGHYPGLHSMTHDYAKLYKSGGSKNFIDEFKEAQGIVNDIIGYKPTLIRAPYGSAPQIGEEFRGDIANAGFKMWDWTIDSYDWKYPGNPGAILSQVQSQLTEDTEVVLMHDREQTTQILQQVIDYIRSEGYEFEVYNPDQHFVCNFRHDERL
nr:polysaccharide deacetylase family protein [Paenibacillus sp. 1001270B_150601_E10]